jgi:ribosome-binding protein aMBF1 (putative translation factor)
MATKIIDLRENILYRVAMLTPAQCRAARGWLDWNQKDLAEKAKVSMSTIRDFESGKRTPIANNVEAMRRAIETAGVQLVVRKGKPVGIAVVDDPLDEEATGSPAPLSDQAREPG